MSAKKAAGTRRPTQADVARRASVSQALVSYVLNDSPVTLPDTTRQRVLDAMDELGYVPHGTARARDATQVLVVLNFLTADRPVEIPGAALPRGRRTDILSGDVLDGTGDLTIRLGAHGFALIAVDPVTGA